MRREAWVEKLVFCAVFIYLFVCYVFIYCLFVVCFLITLRKLFDGSCIDYVVQHRGAWRAICVFWWVTSGLFSFGYDAGYDEKIAFFLNLLLLLFIAIYTIVKYSFYGKTSALIWYVNRCTGLYLDGIIR